MEIIIKVSTKFLVTVIKMVRVQKIMFDNFKLSFSYPHEKVLIK